MLEENLSLKILYVIKRLITWMHPSTTSEKLSSLAMIVSAICEVGTIFDILKTVVC